MFGGWTYSLFVLVKQNLLGTTLTNTPYSINSLFGEFFRKFGGVFLGVFETIYGGYLEGFWRRLGGIWEVFGGKAYHYLTYKKTTKPYFR